MTGIYLIRNVVNGKQYAGSAINLTNRERTHFNQLSEGCHDNRHLQSAWNKYGGENFVFEVFEEIDCLEDLLPWEQALIDFVTESGQGVYNLAPFAGSTFGVKHTEEVRERSSIRQSAKVRARYTDVELEGLLLQAHYWYALHPNNDAAKARFERRLAKAEERRNEEYWLNW